MRRNVFAVSSVVICKFPQRNEGGKLLSGDVSL